MNWLSSLAFAVLLLSIQYDASQSASHDLSKSPWADPEKASSFMDCLITKIVESKVFPQQEKEDLGSIMDTLMSAINGANARGKSNGAQLQAINMAIASSLAEIVVADDAGNPTSIAEKTKDLAGGLEQCFESVMGTVDRKFISEIDNLITIFAKEAASEIQEEQDEEDSSSTESDAQSAQNDGGDQVPKSEPKDVEPEISEPEPIDVEPEVPQTPTELISGLTNEPPREVIRSDIPQQTVRTLVYPDRSSFQTSQSAADTYQSSQIFQGSSQTAGGYGGAYRGSQVSEFPTINFVPQVPQPVPIGVGPQVLQTAPGRTWRVGNEFTDARRTFMRSGVPQQTAPTVVYPNKLPSSSFQTTSQSADTYQSSQTFQGSSQNAGGYEGTYSGSQFPEPTPIDVGPQVSQAATELISIAENDLSDASTRREILRSGVPQQTVPIAGYPNRLYSTSFQTASQSADNTYQSSQTFQGSSQTAGGYRGAHSVPQVSQPTPIGVGDQVSQPAPIAPGPQVSQSAPGRIWRVGNEMADRSTQRSILRSGVPQQTIIRAVYPNRSSSSSIQTGQSAANTYQSSQAFQRASQTAGGYERTNPEPESSEPPVIAAAPQVSKPAPIDVEPQVSQSAPGFISREANKLVDTSTRRAFMRSGVPQRTLPTAVYPNILPSSSFKTSQSGDNTYQSSQTFQGSSQTAGGYRGAYYRPQVSQPTPIAHGPRISQVAPGRIWRVGNEMVDKSTQRSLLRSSVPQQTIPTAMYPNRSSSSSFQTSQSAANTYQSSQTFQGESQTADGSERTNPEPESSEPPAIAAGPQVSKPTPIDVEPQASQAAPGFISREANKLVDTSTRRAVLRSGVPQQTVPKAVYPNRSSFQRTSQSADKTYQSSQTFQGSSQTTDGYRGRYRRPQFVKHTPIEVEPQVLQAATRPISRVVNEQGDTSTRRAVLRSSVPQQTIPTAMYPKRSSLSSIQTSLSSQTFQGLSQTAGGYGRAYSRPQVSQPIPIGVRPQISKAAPAPASSPASQETSNERSCNAPLPEISVLPTLNSPNGLRSGSAGARISQLISDILNAISPNGVDVDALARSLQASVSNLTSSGMSPSDAKLEGLLELIVGLLQIVSNAQIGEINVDTASSVTSAAARSFELALA